MKRIALALIAALLLPSAASSQVQVKGYVKKDGTYVAPHYRSSPNSTKLDNYSTKGNFNPYTGQAGTRDVYSNPYNTTRSQSSSPFSNPYGSSPFGSSASDDSDSDSSSSDPD